VVSVFLAGVLAASCRFGQLLAASSRLANALAAIAAARSRFEQEPSMQRMLAESTRFFEGS
jgi:Flp pilus assembly protein TadG